MIKKIEMWESTDGTKFENETSCLYHDVTELNKKIIENGIKFYGFGTKELIDFADLILSDEVYGDLSTIYIPKYNAELMKEIINYYENYVGEDDFPIELTQANLNLYKEGEPLIFSWNDDLETWFELYSFKANIERSIELVTSGKY